MFLPKCSGFETNIRTLSVIVLACVMTVSCQGKTEKGTQEHRDVRIAVSEDGIPI